MPYKATMIFNLGRNGWSESFYIDTDTSADAIKKAGLIQEARQGLMGFNVTMDGCRLSNTSIRGSTRLIATPPAGNKPLPDCPSPWDAALFSLRFGPGPGGGAKSLYRRNYLMRGLPEDATAGSQTAGLVLAAKYQAEFTGFFDALKNNNAACLVNDKQTVPFVISAIDVVGVSATFTTTANHGLAVNDEVLIGGLVYGWKPSNGRTKITSVPAPNKFVAAVKIIGQGKFFPPGFVQKLTPGLAKFQDSQFLRTVTRDTGKAFFVSAGRSKTRRLST